MKETLMTLSRVESRTGVNQTSSGAWLPAIAFRLWVRSDPKAAEQPLPWVTMTTSEAKTLVDSLSGAIAMAATQRATPPGKH